MSRPPACIACGNERHALRYRGPDRMHDVPGMYDVLACEGCGLLRLWPPPSAETLSRHYPAAYYSHAPAPDADSIPQAPSRRRAMETWLTRSRFDTRLARAAALAGRLVPLGCYVRGVEVRPGGRLLDVGCGDGRFLDLARDLGMATHGVELHAAAAASARARGHEVRVGELAGTGYPEAFFDVVTLNHTLEHLAYPVSTLREVRRILRPGGALFVQVPNTASFAHRLFGRHWVSLDVPRHLFGFSDRNLEMLLTTCGFAVERRRWVGTPLQFRGSLRYALNTRRRPRLLSDMRGLAHSRAAEAVLLPPAILLNLLRQGDAIEVRARRPVDASP